MILCQHFYRFAGVSDINQSKSRLRAKVEHIEYNAKTISSVKYFGLGLAKCRSD